MENYIVRIYRRDTTDPEKMAGIFESVENQTQDAFTSLGSLVDLLTPKRNIHPALGEPDNDEPAPMPETAALSD